MRLKKKKKKKKRSKLQIYSLSQNKNHGHSHFLRYKNYAVDYLWLSVQLPTFPSLSLTKSFVNINPKKVHVLVGDATVIHTL